MIHLTMNYQVGGSLKFNNPTYVFRQADEQLYAGLKAGNFCYVLNRHHTGKSSLLHQTIHRLEKEDYKCVYLNTALLGSKQTTQLQWYKALIASLLYKLNLAKQVNFQNWWEQQSELEPVLRLHTFIEQVLLNEVKNNRILIFIDNINSLLSLNCQVSDFFIWIRHFYNQQAYNPNFKRLGFALSGAASPSNLVSDKYPTPFKIGQAIELNDFQLHEATPLLQGLEEVVSEPQAILHLIIHWTRGQPFLTQKLCQLILQIALENSKKIITIPDGAKGFWVEQLVRSRIIQNWELQDKPEHLGTIRDRLLFDEQKAGKLLRIYQRVLQVEELRDRNLTNNLILASDSEDVTELLLSGLVTNYNSYLRVRNPIYQSVFNLEWVSRQLNNLPL